MADSLVGAAGSTALTTATSPAVEEADAVAASSVVDDGEHSATSASNVERVVSNWECNEQVARALIARGRLTSEDIAHLIHGLTVTPLDVTVEGAHSN